MKQALVLGGGGAVGVAWESGVLAGLADGGFDLRIIEAVIGTSAGSIVGARLLAGFPPLAQPFAAVAEPAAAGGHDIDVELLRTVFRTWVAAPAMTAEVAREVGALAATARRAGEPRFVESFRGLSLAGWPEIPLRITATDTATGERRVFDRGSGIPIEHAIAASSSVPGMFPSVTVEGKLYMDGQVRSSTHADLLVEDRPEHVLIVMPTNELTARGIGPAAQRAVESERRALEAAGVRVTLVTPTREEAATFGGNLMDARRAPEAFELGRATGRALAQDSGSVQT